MLERLSREVWVYCHEPTSQRASQWVGAKHTQIKYAYFGNTYFHNLNMRWRYINYNIARLCVDSLEIRHSS